MKFLQDISEARVIGNSKSGLKRFNARDIADLLFLFFNTIQILKYEFHGLPDLKKYINMVGPLANVDHFVPTKNDVYVFLHVLFGKNNAAQVALLKDQEASEALIQTLKIDLAMVRKFLLLAKTGQSDPSFERRFLLSLESGLRIQDSKYRSIRRLAMDWNKETENTKKLVMTRLLQILRSKARRSELLPMLEKVSRLEKMELKDLSPMDSEGLGQKKPKGSILKTLGLTAAAAGIGYLATRGFKR